MPDKLIQEIHKLLCDYLKHLSSYTVCSITRQNIKFEKSQQLFSEIDIYQTLDTATTKKVNIVCDLLNKLHHDPNAFKNFFKKHSTALGEHRKTLCSRIINAIFFLLTRHNVSSYVFFPVTGKKISTKIEEKLAAQDTHSYGHIC